MRYWFAPIVMLLLVIQVSFVSAQTAVDCGSDLSFDRGVTLQVPDTPSILDYTVTAVGIGPFDPVLAEVDANSNGFCSDDEAEAAYYSAALPSTGEVLPGDNSAQLLFSSNTAHTVILGEYADQPGEALLFLEGGRLDETRRTGRYSLSITPDMIDSGVPLTAYLVAADDSLDPTLAMLGADGAVLTTEDSPLRCDNGGDPASCPADTSDLSDSVLELYVGTLAGAPVDAMLTYALTAADAGSIITFEVTGAGNSTGPYVLVLHLGMGVEKIQLPVASYSEGEAGAVVTCNGQLAFENGLKLALPQLSSETGYTITALGIDDFSPTLAVVGEDGSGYCYQSITSTASYAAELPTTGRVNKATAQAPLRDGAMTVIVGGQGTGEVVLLLEGGEVAAGGTGDVLAVNISPALVNSLQPLVAYMIAAEDALNPVLSQVDADLSPMSDADGLPVTCDDAGFEDDCWGESAELTHASVNGTTGLISAFNIDAMLTLPLNEAMIGGAVNLLPAGAEDTIGGYILALHFALD